MRQQEFMLYDSTQASRGLYSALEASVSESQSVTLVLEEEHDSNKIRNEEWLTQQKEKLARVVGISDVHRIRILSVTPGSTQIKWTVDDLAQDEINKIKSKKKKEYEVYFKGVKSLQIHPSFFVMGLKVDDFDGRGDKTPQEDFSGKYSVGNPAQTYYQPAGWTRYGLNVLGKFGDDTWLHPFQHKNNWWRAYHCTPRDGLEGILQTDFNPSSDGDFGPGLYVSPLVEYAALYNRGGITIQTTQGPKKFHIGFQVAVRPKPTHSGSKAVPDSHRVEVAGAKNRFDAARMTTFGYDTSNTKEWVIANPSSDVRKYGIIIKEV